MNRRFHIAVFVLLVSLGCVIVGNAHWRTRANENRNPTAIANPSAIANLSLPVYQSRDRSDKSPIESWPVASKLNSHKSLATSMPHSFVGNLLSQPSFWVDDEDEFSATDIEFFEREIRPILVNHCYDCHGPDSDFEGNLSLASRGDILVGGDTGPAIVPGDPDESLLIDAIQYGLYEMPPDSKLSDREIELLIEWVERRAPWPSESSEAMVRSDEGFDLDQRQSSHWCWQPIDAKSPPSVSDEQWPIDDMDRFVLARLDQAGLKPNGDASRATWLRRVYLDLIGLLPTEEEQIAFLEDSSPEAYENVVDRLLQSERFGERWARHWLDLVRYAETCGHEFDYPIPHAWRYRDYVIRALNADVPYDQFLKEHIAGDLIEVPRLHPTDSYNESVIGTGFWFLGEATHAPVDVKGDEAIRVDNQIDVMSKTFLGLTVACARCHDHKFDAISTRDYYALAGFLQSSRRTLQMLDSGGQIADRASMLRQIQSEGTNQIVEVIARAIQSPETQDERLVVNSWATMLDEVLGLDTTLDEGSTPTALVDRWREVLANEALNDKHHPAYSLRQLQIAADESQTIEALLSRFKQEADNSNSRREQYANDATSFLDSANGRFENWYLSGQAFVETPEYVSTSVGLDNINNVTPIRWQPLQDGVRIKPTDTLTTNDLSRKLYGVARSPTFEITHPRIHYRLLSENVQIRLIIDGYTMDIYNGLLFGDVSKKSVNTEGEIRWVQQAGDIGRYLGHRAHIEIVDQGDGFAAVEEIWFSNGGSPPEEVSQLTKALSQLESSEAISNRVAEYIVGELQAVVYPEEFESSDLPLVEWLVENQLLPGSDSLNLSLAELMQNAREIAEAVPSPILVQAIEDGTGEDEFVFVRGNHRVLGESAERSLPTALAENWEPVSEGSGRMQLAERMATIENPLTSRVIVNRLWAQMFGQGIVPSVDNFGVLGQEPTHPLLLDYLATELVEQHDWSLKQMIRRMALSRTYRMSSEPRTDTDTLDPNNDLLSRMRIRRLQGEAIRDAMLGLSGQINLAMYGPGVRVHLTSFMQGRGRPGQSGPLDGGHRRSIYQEIRRNFLPPMMIAFDMPIPFSTMGKRNESNVPAQALILMNDPFVHAMASEWAQSVMAADDEDETSRVARFYRQAFGREPTAEETASSLQFLRLQAESLGIGENRFDNQQVWSDFAHVLLNVKEFIFVN